MSKSKLIIGRNDIADFPLLRLKKIKIKVDTGAYTSSIHCHKISVVTRGGKKMLKFYLLDPTHKEYEHKALYSQKFIQKIIKSSNGQNEKRYVIASTIKLGNQLFDIELSLTNRGSMKFPVLLGRKFLMRKFVVDVSKYNLMASQHKK